MPGHVGWTGVVGQHRHLEAACGQCPQQRDLDPVVDQHGAGSPLSERRHDPRTPCRHPGDVVYRLPGRAAAGLVYRLALADRLARNGDGTNDRPPCGTAPELEGEGAGVDSLQRRDPRLQEHLLE